MKEGALITLPTLLDGTHRLGLNGLVQATVGEMAANLARGKDKAIGDNGRGFNAKLLARYRQRAAQAHTVRADGGAVLVAHDSLKAHGRREGRERFECRESSQSCLSLLNNFQVMCVQWKCLYLSNAVQVRRTQCSTMHAWS